MKSKKKRIEKLRKREAERIEEIKRFWNEHKSNPNIDLIDPEYFEEYCRMRFGLMDLQKVIAELEYGKSE